MELNIKEFPCYECITRVMCKPVVYYENNQYLIQCTILSEYIDKLGYSYNHITLKIIEKLFHNMRLNKKRIRI